MDELPFSLECTAGLSFGKLLELLLWRAFLLTDFYFFFLGCGISIIIRALCLE
jgi:hypothetical protein